MSEVAAALVAAVVIPVVKRDKGPGRVPGFLLNLCERPAFLMMRSRTNSSAVPSLVAASDVDMQGFAELVEEAAQCNP